MIRFSIAIPAYKKKYLSKCIQSILNQDYDSFELIIVNDDSPENLEEIINDFSDKRIKYFKNEKNCGVENVVDNWNICLSYATGEYFILMGDDDEMMPNYLSEFNNLIVKFPDLDVYHCRSFIINDNSEIKSLTPSWPEWESVYENIWHRMKGLRSQYISDFVYRTQFLIDRKGFFKLPAAWASDDITSFEAATKKGIAHTQTPLFCYRETEVTISSSGSVALKLEAIKGEEKWYNDFLEINIPVTKTDICYRNNIENYKNKYFLNKRIETVSYYGIRKNFFLQDFIKFCLNRKKIGLNFQHIVYAGILAVKKIKSQEI